MGELDEIGESQSDSSIYWARLNNLLSQCVVAGRIAGGGARSRAHEVLDGCIPPRSERLPNGDVFYIDLYSTAAVICCPLLESSMKQQYRCLAISYSVASINAFPVPVQLKYT
eukprot:COSAG01_NODE_9349_length_2473_cov_2.327717_1_plen_113_part_00